jgi:cell division protein FtsI/penicillin-binding protein 2
VIETVYIRLRFALMVCLVLTGLVVVQLLRVTFLDDYRRHFSELGDLISVRERNYAPSRGLIYDRDGELMATNDVEYELGLSPPYVVNRADVIDTLSELLDMSPSEIERAVRSDALYVLIKRPVSAEIGNEIKRRRAAGEASLNGVSLVPIPRRNYPSGPLAGQLLGFVAYNYQGQQVGYFGVEGFYNELLAGRPVRGFEHLVPFDVQPNPKPDQGTDIYLTVDRDVQYLVEVVMADAIARYGARGGTIIVMQPRTGEILGMSSWPTYDPNNYVQFPPTNPANPAVSGQIEPGSTFKVLTMAAAMDAGLVTANTPFMDNGYIEVGGAVIRNWNYGGWGPVDMQRCMQYSLNVCLAAVATWVGPNTFYNYMSAFGVGHLTGVDLAAETAGRLKRPGDPDWYDSDLATNSFGQGVAVSPLQLITAVSAIANGGTMMQPHVLRQVAHTGRVHVTQNQVLGRPIRPETAAALTQMLVDSLEAGEGSQALVPGYRIAGKTGTAQIPMPGGYHPRDTIGSFIGWGPVDNPQFIVLVVLDRPTTSQWGSETAAPVFKQLVERLVVLLEIPPDDVRRELQAGN